MGLDLHPAITILVALAPALHVWWRNRHLARLLDDPALPERLMAERVRTRAVFAGSLGILIVTGFDRLAWAVPLLIVTRMAAAYPFRKVLLGETWSFFAYLSFYLRLCLAYFGWIVLSFLPGLIGLSASHPWIDAILFGGVAAVWTTWFSTAFRRILGTVPVTSPALIARFEDLRQRCGLPPIDLEQVAVRGGVFANAAALPSLTSRAVVITETLAERFDEEELTAILAHELAHHEHYNRRRLMKRQIGTYTLIVTGVFLSPILQAVAPGAMTLGLVMWMAAVLVSLGLSAQHRQKHETESDLRAVELTGNPEALVRALTKLNALSHLPRRWSTEWERRATHPSLARRIQAIRNASDAPAPKIVNAETFADATGAATMTFGEAHLAWSEGGAASHHFAYDALSELRIDVGKSGAPRVIAVDSKGRRWEFALQQADVARAQATLDSVDGRLGNAAPPPPHALSALNPVRVLAWVGIVLAASVGQIAVLIPVLLAALRPAAQLLGAAGAAVVAASILGWRDDPFRLYGISQIWVDAVLLLCGVALLVAAFMRRQADESSHWKLLAVVGVCAASAWTMIALSGTSSIDLYRSVREWPSAPVLTLACAGGLAFSRGKHQRAAAPPVVAVGLLAMFMGSTVFADRFVDDPFVVRAADIVVTPVAAVPPLREQKLPFYPSHAWLSPDGGYVAISSDDENENVTIHAGPVGGNLTDFAADEAVFVGESRVLLLEREARASVIRLIDLQTSTRETWSIREPLRSANLSVDRSSQHWRLLGLDQAGHVVSAEGRVGDGAVRRTVWSSPSGEGSATPIAASRGAVLALESRSVFSPMENMFVRTPFLPSHFRLETRLWSLAGGESSLVAASLADVECTGSTQMNDAAVCTGFDGTSTRFFAMTPEAGRLEPMASMAGRFHTRGNLDGGWLAGWMNGTPVLLHPATAEAIRMPESSTDRVYQLAMGAHVIGAMSWARDASTLRIYPRP